MFSLCYRPIFQHFFSKFVLPSPLHLVHPPHLSSLPSLLRMLPALYYTSLFSLFPISATYFHVHFFLFVKRYILPAFSFVFFHLLFQLPVFLVSHFLLRKVCSIHVSFPSFLFVHLFLTILLGLPLSLMCPSSVHLTYRAHSFPCYPHFTFHTLYYYLDQSCSSCHQTSSHIHFANLCFYCYPGVSLSPP